MTRDDPHTNVSEKSATAAVEPVPVWTSQRRMSKPEERLPGPAQPHSLYIRTNLPPAR